MDVLYVMRRYQHEHGRSGLRLCQSAEPRPLTHAGSVRPTGRAGRVYSGLARARTGEPDHAARASVTSSAARPA